MATRGAVILLVEDDPNDVLFMCRALKKAQIRQSIRVASDGQQAIDYLEGSGIYGDRTRYPFPCLVLLDLKLPKKSGLEVLRWVRNHGEHKDVPVVMLTSSGQEEDRSEAMRQGIESYQVKPLSFDALVRLANEIREEADDHCGSAEPAPEERP
jgi:DNA-binding response OmpR family regulator